jgi:quaternary ammonium compound-resistance protein SugE
MGWFALMIAGALEIVWALALKYSQGFTLFWPSAITVLAVIFSFIFLGLALKSVPFGTAYAIWTGVGAAGAIVAGMALFGESADAIRIGCLILIIAGTIGLRLVTPA